MTPINPVSPIRILLVMAALAAMTGCGSSASSLAAGSDASAASLAVGSATDSSLATSLPLSPAGPPSSTGTSPFPPGSTVYPFTHIKTAMIDYMPGGWNGPVAKDPTILPFMSSHYNLIIGGGENLASYGSTPPPQYAYTNYYCMYVGNAEYLDAQNWAKEKGVDFESFFIHYDSPTVGCFGSTCYQMPAGSRVPTYNWYGTAGNMNLTGARVVTNPGNPNYRLWKVDYLDRFLKSNANYSGVMVDNTNLANVGVAQPRYTSGGTFTEYPGTAAAAGISYGNDLLQLFKEFKARMGASQGQLPNVGNLSDSQTRINLAYNSSDPSAPYIKGIFREMTLAPHRDTALEAITKDIDAAQSKGVENIMGGGVFVGPRFTIPSLAEFYMVKTNSTYFMPFLQYAIDSWMVDPRINQWIPAIAYNVGQPKNDAAGPVKYQRFAAGIDPSSGPIEAMTVTSTNGGGGSYRLTDPSKNWTADQWRGKRIVFPSGYTTSVYHSGTNWIDLWAPAEIPAPGSYQIGTTAYTVLQRQFENAIVLFKPLPSYTTKETGAPSLTTHQLPALDDNPSGQYYLLNADGTVNTTPISSIMLRNADGAILIKQSKAKF